MSFNQTIVFKNKPVIIGSYSIVVYPLFLLSPKPEVRIPCISKRLYN